MGGMEGMDGGGHKGGEGGMEKVNDRIFIGADELSWTLERKGGGGGGVR